MHAAPQFRVVHHMVCRHQVEVMVQPPRAQLYFHDERWIDPIDTQLRFEAVVYNTDHSVHWEVFAPNGGPGRGTIDQTGLYNAPDKGALPSGTSELIVATARADPLRKAFAWVTLIGLGPLPAPVPEIEIWPKRVTLYYESFFRQPLHRRQQQTADLSCLPRRRTGPAGALACKRCGSARHRSVVHLIAPNGGGTAEVTVVAQLLADAAVQDDAKVTLLNYQWPGF